MLKYILLSLVIVTLLVFRYVSFYSHQIEIPEGKAIHFQARLLSEPKRTDRHQILQFRLSGKRFFLRIPSYPSFKYGQVLLVRGITKQSQDDANIFFLEKPSVTLAKEQGILFPFIVSLQDQIKTVFRHVLPSTASSLLLGIVYGIREGMPKEFLESLQRTGMLHVIAASGMNVSFVAGAVIALLQPFFRRQRAIVLACLIVWFYAFMAGLEPSIIRAAAMATFGFMAGLLGRQYIGLFSLIFIGCLMLLWSPETIFDIGFQLSFLATAGIITATQLFSQGKGFLQALKSDILTTASAQLATMPLLLSTFGSYSLLSLVVNILVVWTVPLLMILGSIAGVLAFLFPGAASLFLWLALPFLLYFEATVAFFAKIPFSLTVKELHWSIVVGYYFVLTAFFVWRMKKRQLRSKEN